MITTYLSSPFNLIYINSILINPINMKKTRRAARITRKNTRFRSGPLRGGASDNDYDDDYPDDYLTVFLERLFRAIDQPDGSRHLKRLLAKPLYKMELNNTSQPVEAYGESFWESLLHRAVTQTYDIRPDKYKADDLKKVSILLDFKGIDVNIQDSNGQTPLMVTRSVECVELLLAHPGIKVNAVDHEGRTALWHAAALGSKADNDEERYKGKEYHANDALEISMLLFLAGADTTIADEYGKTVVEVAKDVGLTTGSLVDVLSTRVNQILSTRANHSANMDNFKSFVTEMKYTPVDEHNPRKISFFYEDYINLKKIYTKKKLETFFKNKLRASSKSRGRGQRKTERKLK